MWSLQWHSRKLEQLRNTWIWYKCQCTRYVLQYGFIIHLPILEQNVHAPLSFSLLWLCHYQYIFRRISSSPPDACFGNHVLIWYLSTWTPKPFMHLSISSLIICMHEFPSSQIFLHIHGQNGLLPFSTKLISRLSFFPN